MSIQSDLQTLANKDRARLVARYFKTGKGEYGEGDVFIGLTLPQIRMVVKKYRALPLSEITKLLHNEIHEYRMTALFILIDQFKKAEKADKKIYYDFYLANTKWINNWDLVDLSAKYIVGGYLLDKKGDRKILYKLAKSKSVWERRIAVLGTFLFIDKKDFRDSLRLANLFMHDRHDLMHKAVGWMLREVGKKDEKTLVDYLSTRYKMMPRTMLRYAIEKFDEKRRTRYLHGEI
jgi:3-methyladenine DNA glycosylase AlkD